MAIAGAVVAVLLGLAGCGDQRERSTCDAFATFVDTRNQIAAIDPEGVDAQQAITVAERYLAAVRGLREDADGRYGNELDDAQASVEDILVTLRGMPDDADRATWWPLVREDLQTAADASITLERAVAPSCGAEVTTFDPTTTTTTTTTTPPASGN